MTSGSEGDGELSSDENMTLTQLALQKYVGRYVVKQFDHVPYVGQVTAAVYADVQQQWLLNIRYRDGDSEDMTETQVQKYLQ